MSSPKLARMNREIGSEKQKVEPKVCDVNNQPPAGAPMRRKRPRRAAKPGYCESCNLYYNDFYLHLDSHTHKQFISDSNNFNVLDAFMQTVPTLSDFVGCYDADDASTASDVTSTTG